MLKRACFAVPLCFLFSPGNAEIDTTQHYTGGYAGMGITYSNVYAYTDTCFGCYGTADYGSGSAGFAVTAGYRPIPYLGAELAYVNQDNPTWSQTGAALEDPPGFYDVNTKIDLSSLQVSVLAVLPFGNVGEVYLRGGAAFWQGQGNQTLVGDTTITREVENDGTSFVLGVGGGVTLADHWHINLDYVYYPVSDDLVPVDIANNAYTDVLTVQVLYRFDTSRQP